MSEAWILPVTILAICLFWFLMAFCKGFFGAMLKDLRKWRG